MASVDMATRFPRRQPAETTLEEIVYRPGDVTARLVHRPSAQSRAPGGPATVSQRDQRMRMTVRPGRSTSTVNAAADSRSSVAPGPARDGAPTAAVPSPSTGG